MKIQNAQPLPQNQQVRRPVEDAKEAQAAEKFKPKEIEDAAKWSPELQEDVRPVEPVREIQDTSAVKKLEGMAEGPRKTEPAKFSNEADKSGNAAQEHVRQASKSDRLQEVSGAKSGNQSHMGDHRGGQNSGDRKEYLSKLKETFQLAS